MKKSFTILFLTLITISCGTKSLTDKQELLKEISNYEKSLLNDTTGNVNITAAYELIKCYSKFYNNYPTDSITPEILFKQANIFQSIAKYKEAISTIEKIEKEYPNYKKIDICIFMKANIYENYLNDLKNAEKFYKLYLKQYPNGSLAKDAEFLLQNLGKSPEELFNSLNKNDTLNI